MPFIICLILILKLFIRNITFLSINILNTVSYEDQHMQGLLMQSVVFNFLHLKIDILQNLGTPEVLQAHCSCPASGTSQHTSPAHPSADRWPFLSRLSCRPSTGTSSSSLLCILLHFACFSPVCLLSSFLCKTSFSLLCP